MYCSACGNQIAAGARYCSYCGALIQQAGSPSPAPQPPAPVVMREPAPAAAPVPPATPPTVTKPPDTWDGLPPANARRGIGELVANPSVAAAAFGAAVVLCWLFAETGDSAAENFGMLLGMGLGTLGLGAIVTGIVFLIPDGRRYFAGRGWLVTFWASCGWALMALVGATLE